MIRFRPVLVVLALAICPPAIGQSTPPPIIEIDRIVAVNIIGTKTAVLLVIIGLIFRDVAMFVDFALAYALLNFIGSLAASRYLHKTLTTSEQMTPPLDGQTKNG